jgi:hypothetical protein
MPHRHSEAMDALREAVLETAGELDRETRYAVLTGSGPPGLQPYLDKVRRHAYKVVDGDVDALKQAGWSEDALFEATVATAVGEGLRRLELGLAALG